jgi:hypothetical protein
LACGAKVRNLGVLDVNITGCSYYAFFVGGLVGQNEGTLTQCYSTGAVSGRDYVGGLAGGNSGTVTACFWDTQTSG